MAQAATVTGMTRRQRSEARPAYTPATNGTHQAPASARPAAAIAITANTEISSTAGAPGRTAFVALAS